VPRLSWGSGYLDAWSKTGRTHPRLPGAAAPWQPDHRPALDPNTIGAHPTDRPPRVRDSPAPKACIDHASGGVSVGLIIVETALWDLGGGVLPLAFHAFKGPANRLRTASAGWRLVGDTGRPPQAPRRMHRARRRTVELV
jgi:hypothetical protein